MALHQKTSPPTFHKPAKAPHSYVSSSDKSDDYVHPDHEPAKAPHSYVASSGKPNTGKPDHKPAKAPHSYGSAKLQGKKLAEDIIAEIAAKHNLLSEGGSKAFLDAKAKLKEVGMHIHKTGWDGEYRVVHHSEKGDADAGHFTDDLDDALHTGLHIAKSYQAGK